MDRLAPRPRLARPRGLWVSLLGLLVTTSASLACKPRGLENPPALSRTIPKSRISADANRLIEALAAREIAPLLQWMTPTLRGQVDAGTLSAASDRLRMRFGEPLGILEERMHREGDLVWYSGLVLHGKPDRGQGTQARGTIRLVLYQFAVNPAAQLDKLLVREHLWLEELEPPAEAYLPITRFYFPSTGEWTVGHGGRRRATNYHHGSRKQRYAYDIGVHEGGRSRRGSGKRNEDYFCYGRPVLAPAPGVVVQAIDGVPENRPGTKGKAGGNGVVIDHGFGEMSSLWHFIPGSVMVRVGDRVELGQPLGKVGNSGQSTNPHIHFHVSTRERRNDGFGLPAPFVDVYVDGIWHDKAMPVRDERVRGTMPQRTAAAQARGPEILLDL
ncbi:MAG: M23 family metallopeptidase [Myxococcales bacterium]|nr:M23 family metallopeptidase [Myxococcales bacterium]